MSDQDYEVGYGKPPRHSQFKKGQSGNTKGRPKGSKNFARTLRNGMNRKMIVSENGERRSITVHEAFVHKLIENALHGKTSDQIRLLREMERLTPDLLEDRSERTTKIVFSFDGGEEGLNLTKQEREKVDRFLELIRSGHDVPLDPLDF